MAIIVGAAIIAAVIGVGFTQLQPSRPLPAAPQVISPAAPTANEKAVDAIEDQIDDFAISGEQTVENKAKLKRQVTTQIIKFEAEEEQVKDQLTTLIKGDSMLEKALVNAAAQAGGDLHKLGQSQFLVDVSPDVRVLFLRQQELLAQGRRLETQVKVLERLTVEQAAPEPEPPPKVTASPRTKPATAKAAPVVDPSTLPRGKLIINSIPWGEVTLDDKALGSTPQQVETYAGKHKVIINTTDGRSEEQSISVQAGKNKTFCWDFNEEDVCK
jgi:hypothetical protein